MRKNLLILGATSDMAMAIAEEFAKEGYDLKLAARDAKRLKSFVADKQARYGVSADLIEFDVQKDLIKDEIINNAHVVVTAIGYLGNQEAAVSNWAESQAIIDLNYTSIVRHLNQISRVFKERKSGVIVGISSVAGDRGRGSNFLYGSSKAAFTAYLSGLRNELFKAGVHVLTVKPGFVNTKMTSELNLPKKLTASPQQVAKGVFRAVRRRKNTLYVLPIWLLVMRIIKLIPEGVFKKMNL